MKSSKRCGCICQALYIETRHSHQAPLLDHSLQPLYVFPTCHYRLNSFTVDNWLFYLSYKAQHRDGDFDQGAFSSAQCLTNTGINCLICRRVEADILPSGTVCDYSLKLGIYLFFLFLKWWPRRWIWVFLSLTVVSPIELWEWCMTRFRQAVFFLVQKNQHKNITVHVFEREWEEAN